MKKRKLFGTYMKDDMCGWLMLFPVILCMALVKWYPIIAGIFRSFFATRGYEITEFVGLQNYIDVLSDTLFITTLKNTVMYVIWSLIIGFIPPILVAVLLNEIRFFKKGFRVITYIPYLAPMVVTSLIFTYLYMPGENGFLNMILAFVGIPPQEWLQNPSMTIPLIIVAMTFTGMPGSAVVYLAALQNVPNELYEASIIDGAPIWQRFCKITLPSISTTMLLLTARQVIGVFQVMQEPLIMTGGGPQNASMSINLAAYNYAFTYMKVSRSLALGTCAFIFLMILSVIYFRLKKRLEE